MTEQARILVEETEVFRGRMSRTYEWQGPRWATTQVDWYAWERLQREAPWPLKTVPVDDCRSTFYTVARVDGTAKIAWLWWVTRAWMKNRTALLKVRFILTLMVWGLAYVHESETADWCHIGRKYI